MYGRKCSRRRCRGQRAKRAIGATCNASDAGAPSGEKSGTFGGGGAAHTGPDAQGPNAKGRPRQLSRMKNLMSGRLILQHFPFSAVLLICPASFAAQYPGWTVPNLSNAYDQVQSIAVEGNGDGWIGTNEGVVRTDGTNWTAYDSRNSGLPYYDISSIAIDKNGDKWIGTYGGFAKFDGTTWTAYTTSNSGLPDNGVEAITTDVSGNEWIGTDGGLAKFDGKTWIIYTTSNSGLPERIVYCQRSCQIRWDQLGSV